MNNKYCPFCKYGVNYTPLFRDVTVCAVIQDEVVAMQVAILARVGCASFEPRSAADDAAVLAELVKTDVVAEAEP